jgi:tetratricopeptide (TPR) repeat protein
MISGDFKEANSDLDQIKEIEKETFEDYYYGAFLDYQLNNIESSIANLKNLTKRYPDNTEAILQLGILQLSLQKYLEACETLSLITNEDRNYKKAILYKFQALIKIGQFKDAFLELKNINFDDQNDYLIIASQVYYLNENYELAAEYLTKFMENNPDNNNSKLLLNLIRANQGKLNNTEEINEFEFKENFKRDAQILNGILNFEKGQYYSAKYRISNINNLSSDEQKCLKPLLLYAEKQIS